MANAVTIEARAFLLGLAKAYHDFKVDGETYIHEVAERVVVVARSLAPSGPTGELKGSIDMRPGRDASGPYFDVGTSLQYAIFVEYGTYKDRAQHFMLPALGFGASAARKGGVKTTRGGERRVSLFRKRERARGVVRKTYQGGGITAGEARQVSRELSQSSRYRYRARRRRR